MRRIHPTSLSRSLLVFALASGAFGLVAACGGEAPPPVVPPVASAEIPPLAPPPPPPEVRAAAPTKTPLEIQGDTISAYYEAWNAGETKRVGAAYTDDAVLVVAGLPEMKGRRDIESNVQRTLDAFPKGKFAVARSFQRGDVAVVEWVFNGTHSGEYLGLKGTEKPVGFHGASLFQTNGEGKITSQHDYYDGATVLAQVGQLKEKPLAIPKLPAATEGHVSKGTPEEDKNVGIAKAYYVATDKKSEAELLGVLSENIEYDDFTQTAPAKGKAQARKSFAVFSKAFPDGKQAPELIFGADGFVVSESLFVGTNKGPFGRVAPTKKSLTMKGIDIFEVKDGKLQRVWTYTNRADVMMQLGLIRRLPPQINDEGNGADAKANQGRPFPAQPPAPSEPKAPPSNGAP